MVSSISNLGSWYIGSAAGSNRRDTIAQAYFEGVIDEVAIYLSARRRPKSGQIIWQAFPSRRRCSSQSSH
jgi:hypothetical protein